jgi:protein-serine/threonine kinase
MQTSCGSPCYAAPELVISEGLYVGSAVDIWSCGVILYAMLAGYLPFDDDPQNPDGDNINLLYKYILNTQLTFPDYVSPAARDLLSKMLVPDPSRRSDLKAIMAHEWLRPYSYLFDKSVDELERLATEQQRQKRLAYQNSMRAAAAQEQAKMSRSQSARTDMPLVGSGTPATSRSRSTRDHPPVAGQHRPQDFYDNSGILESPAHPVPSGRRAVVSATIPLSTSPVEQNPFSRDFPTTLGPKDEYASPMDPRTRKGSKSSATKKSSKPPTQQSVEDPSKKKNHGGFRHTIQLEYDDGESPTSPAPASAAPRKRTTSQSTAHLMSSSPLPSPPSEPAVSPVHAVGAGAVPNGKAQSPYFHPASDAVDDRSGTPRKRTDNTTELSATPHSGRHAQSPSRSDESARSGTKESERSSPITNGYGTPRASATKSAPAPTRDTPTPTATQNGSPQQSQPDTQASSVTSTSSQSTTGSQSKHRHGLSMDKLGLGKLLGNDNSQPQPSNNTSNNRSKPPVSGTGSGSRKRSDSKLSNGTADDGSVKSTEKKSRRTTLSLMVEPFGRFVLYTNYPFIFRGLMIRLPQIHQRARQRLVAKLSNHPYVKHHIESPWNV